MAMVDIIRDRLEDALAPRALEIIDESEKHRGHAGYREGGESHFHVKIVSDAFRDQSRVKRQRLVMQALKSELEGAIHALSMETKTPEEVGN